MPSFQSSPPPELLSLLNLLASGERTVEQVYHELRIHVPLADGATVSESDAGDLRIDLDRARRCGFPEVVYAPGKSHTALVVAFQHLLSHGHGCLATRCDADQATALIEAFPNAIYNEGARTVRINVEEPAVGKVVVVTAGTSDRPVAEEAVETLRWMNVDVDLIMDVGVAGPQRFLQARHRFAGAQAVVVLAGMEGALPSVVGGWVNCPVIAVPTSVGYGASFGGISALLGMLNSCTANVAVVNIDAGFKGAYLAGMIARQSARTFREKTS